MTTNKEEKIVDKLFGDLDSEPTPWYQTTWWTICRKYSDIEYFFRKQIQRIKYGFPSEQAWNFNWWHAEIVTPRLKHLRKNLNGHPGNLNMEEWENILDKIIWSFEHFSDEVDVIYSDDYDHRYAVSEDKEGDKTYRSLNEKGTIDWTLVDEHNKRVQEGLDLFSKYYQNLWD